MLWARTPHGADLLVEQHAQEHQQGSGEDHQHGGGAGTDDGKIDADDVERFYDALEWLYGWRVETCLAD